MTEILLIGCGNMGFSMLQRWTSEHVLDVVVVEPVPILLARAVERGAKGYPQASDLPAGSGPDVVVLATKPQSVAGALRALGSRLRPGAVVVSVAAGVSLATIEAEVPSGVGVVRCMPNTPASIGEGMIVCHAAPSCTPPQQHLAERLMSAVGRVAFVDDEALMDAVTAVSGSGPAYVFYFIECLARAGERAGLPSDLALLLATQTAYGASSLAAGSPEHPGLLRERVTSPNGTTAAGLAVLMSPEAGLDPLLARCVDAARCRSVALGRR